MNQDLRIDAEDVRGVSPLFWPIAAGRVFDAVVGGLESSEFKRQSRIVTDTWRKRRAETRYEEFAGMNHFTVTDALADPKSAMVNRLVDLAQRR
jgi:arylformamidase